MYVQWSLHTLLTNAKCKVSTLTCDFCINPSPRTHCKTLIVVSVKVAYIIVKPILQFQTGEI